MRNLGCRFFGSLFSYKWIDKIISKRNKLLNFDYIQRKYGIMNADRDIDKIAEICQKVTGELIAHKINMKSWDFWVFNDLQRSKQ